MKKSRATRTFYYLLVKGWRAVKPRKNIFKNITLLPSFFRDYNAYKKANTTEFTTLPEHLYPCIFDKTEQTPLDYTYFYQDTWCAKKVFENKPTHHYDFGSKAETVGIVSQFVPTTMIDIRPIDVELPGLSFRKEDILHTSFADDSIESLSSICVLEHIGLGRYGDAINPVGTEQSVAEIKRILAHNANLYISLPIDNANRIYFNAHRAFTRDYVLQLFAPLQLIEEKYIYGRRTQDMYDPSKGFGTGMFHFKKI